MNDECVFDVTEQIKAMPKGITVERAEIHILYHNNENAELRNQINQLADYIVQSVPGEPSESEGAVDCSIRIMSELQRKLDIAVEALIRISVTATWDWTHTKIALEALKKLSEI